ncbi:MAG: 4'-phosphopantetheinyl transferase superfamily protein [Woeseiaceae bacterium]|nr:4'-phosphopantetheinyl transferase superfamily protein [Woeseiaceae bacterium]
MSPVLCTTQAQQQLPADLDWLTTGERERLDGFRFDKRRRDWLLGRWAAKNALLGISGLATSDISRFEVDSAPNGAPVPRLDGRPYPVSLSLSHSKDRAFSAVSSEAVALGCDIELVEPRSDVFVETYFTESERADVEAVNPSDRDALVTKIWSAKESTLKALQTGLQADTRSVEVVDDGKRMSKDWGIARTIVRDDGELSCLWRLCDDFVLTIATRGIAEAPEER